MNAKLKSPLNRIGGKHFLANWITGMIPESHKIFVEVCCGSCVISLTKRPSETTIVNDLDSHLISFWRTIQDAQKRERLISLLDGMLYSRELWQELRTKWKSGIVPSDPVESSAQWFYLNRSCYASDIKNGGFIGYTHGRNMCKTFRNAVDQLNEVGEIIKGYIVENMDFRNCISRFDNEDVVFFVDAPYLLDKPDKSLRYYGNEFGINEHIELSKLLHEAKGRVMFCHYEHPEIGRLYSKFYKYKFDSFSGAVNQGEKRKTTECLYMNFKPHKTQSLFDV